MPVVNETRQEQAIERYSFSKLSSWWVCPYGYYQRYIEHKAGIGNAFASFGTLVHELLEKYAKGEAELWDLPQMYEWMFDGTESVNGLIATLYTAAWAFSELRHRLAAYEDTGMEPDDFCNVIHKPEDY